jgi:hypothetical protein
MEVLCKQKKAKCLKSEEHGKEKIERGRKK